MNNSPQTAPPSAQSGKVTFTSWAPVTVLAIVLFTPLVAHLSATGVDYIGHVYLALKMAAARTILSPHFLLQAAIIAEQALLPISANSAATLTVVLAIAATAALLARSLAGVTGNRLLAGAVTIGLLLAAPIPLLMPLDHHIYFGYIGINVSHNPTILLLKPFALFIFAFICSRPSSQIASSAFSLLAVTLATIGCALAKPNYIIVIIPALFIACAFPSLRRLLNRRRIAISATILLPALLVLAGQYWHTYTTQQAQGLVEGQSHIIFAPLAVMSGMSAWLPAKLILSLAFPLAVTIAYFPQARVNSTLLFAWLTFAIGAGYTYLFAESGPRMMHGNFCWSGQITLFILFAATAEFFLEQTLTRQASGSRRFKTMLCAALFILHILSGIAFYAVEYSASERFW